MALTVEEILVKITEEGSDELQGKLDKTSRKLGEWQAILRGKLRRSQADFNNQLRSEKLENHAKQLKQVTGQFDSFGGAMRMPMKTWKKVNEQGGKFNTMGGRMGNRLRTLTHGLRGFRMEMLGVMFFGQGMVKFFTGLLKPAFQATGIFELFSQVLQIVFLPIVLALLPFLLKLADWLINMPESLKLIIGIITIFGTVLGFIIMIVGTLALGIGSIILAFGGFIAIIFSVVASFVSMFGWAGKLAAALAFFGIIIPGVTAFGDEIERQGGLWEKIKGWLMVVVGWLDNLWDKFLEWAPVQKMMNQFSEDVRNKIRNPIKTLKEDIPKFFNTTWEKVSKETALWWRVIETTIHQKVTAIKKDFKDWMDTFSDENKQKIDDMAFVISALASAIRGFVGALALIPAWWRLSQSFGATAAHAITGKPIPPGLRLPGTGGFTGSFDTTSTGGQPQSVTLSPIINVYASPGMDIDKLVDKVSSKVTEDFKRLSRR